MGATAIGTGISSEPEYAGYCTEAMAKITGWDITLTEDLVGATSDTSEMVGYSSALRRIAIKINKICNDLPSPLQRPSLRSRRNQPPCYAARLLDYAR